MNAGENDRQVAYIGLGSNLDDPTDQITAAFGLLDKLPRTQVTGRSSLYRSAPFGPVKQPDFVNAVASIVTSLTPVELLGHLQQIERDRGRIRVRERWGPRVLDLDLLVFSDHEISSPELTVPHPGIGARNFVLLPLRELAPDLVIPGLGRVSDIDVSEDEPRIFRMDHA